ncbi:MAG: M28 family metallopeptidase [Robiginitomaculum sp.]
MSLQKFSVLLMLALVLGGCDGELAEQKIQKQPTIMATDIGKRIERLASDEFEGREPGTKGGRLASQYVADQMKSAGLVPMGKNGTYFQPITLTKTTVLPNSYMEINEAGAKPLRYDFMENSIYWTKRYQESVSVKDADLIFVGYGIVAPEYGWNDYEGIDVKGKTVVMLVNDPGYATKDVNLFNGSAMTYYGRWTYKYEEAARQGAAAALIVHETKPASYSWDVVSSSWSGAQIDLVRLDKGAGRVALEGWLSIDASKALFKRAGLFFDDLKTAATRKGFKPVPMGTLQMNAQINNTIETTKSRNVIGAVKGTKYPDEYVLYMAHWDHLGNKPMEDGSDGIFNGAVDNATGTAVILEIGQAFATKPAERSALFIAVTAEESGLLGSAYYSEDPIVPLNKTVAGINSDAIMPLGRTKDIVVVGYGASQLDDALESIIAPKGMYITPDPKPEAGYYYRSDHISLAKKGVPMLYADNGVDHEIQGKTYGKNFGDEYTKERYHKPTDEYDNSWDLTGLEQMCEILYELGYGLANSQEWPNWNKTAEFRMLRDNMMSKKTGKEK